jgi:2-oxo-4-hydroxy-4-carboxy-5-ureidoimidazoline decarboxylase
MAERRPIADEATLLAAADETWRTLAREDWLQAFSSHLRIGESGIGESGIGESRARGSVPVQSASWSRQEQETVAATNNAVKIDLFHANQEYERRFGRIFIVCASGRSAPEILETLRQRMGNDEDTELHEAAEQQRLITRLRLKKWLSE